MVALGEGWSPLPGLSEEPAWLSDATQGHLDLLLLVAGSLQPSQLTAGHSPATASQMGPWRGHQHVSGYHSLP